MLRNELVANSRAMAAPVRKSLATAAWGYLSCGLKCNGITKRRTVILRPVPCARDKKRNSSGSGRYRRKSHRYSLPSGGRAIYQAHLAHSSWMTAPAEEALKLQRPLPDGALRIVATGAKEDGPVEVPAR